MSVQDVAVAVLLLGGASFALLASIGLQRFDSVFARMHAATKVVTLGLVLVVAAAVIRVDDVGSRAKLVLAAALQFITAPLAAHMVARAAYRAGTELNPGMVVDELAGVDVDADVDSDYQS
jgi:multicomponent Na+:H+ antiporter subunit G